MTCHDTDERAQLIRCTSELIAFLLHGDSEAAVVRIHLHTLLQDQASPSCVRDPTSHTQIKVLQQTKQNGLNYADTINTSDRYDTTETHACTTHYTIQNRCMHAHTHTHTHTNTHPCIQTKNY